LKLTDDNGIKDELPPITTFLNRLLALTIDLQNIYLAFEQLLSARDRGAIASGYAMSDWTLTAELRRRRRQRLHPSGTRETRLLTSPSANGPAGHAR
jgi:hypothetical protein